MPRDRVLLLFLPEFEAFLVLDVVRGLLCNTQSGGCRASDDPNGSHLSRSRFVFRLFAYRRVFVGEHSGLTANFLHTKVYGTFMSKPLLHLFAAVFACHRRGARCDYLTQLSSVAGRLAIAKVDAK